MILDLVVRPPGQALGNLRPTVAQLPVLLAHYVLFLLGPFAFPDGRICASKQAGRNRWDVHYVPDDKRSAPLTPSAPFTLS